MGRVIKVLAEREQAPEERLEVTRLVVELSENIHIHLRDLRIEMSLYEWREFSALLAQARAGIEHFALLGWHEGTDEHHAWRADVTDRPQWPDRVRLEENANGTIHLHWHEQRLELTSKAFSLLKHDMTRAEPGQPVALDTLMIRRRCQLGQWEHLPLRESIFHTALILNRREEYDVYRDRAISYPESRGCLGWSEHLELAESIRRGWRADSFIQLEADNRTIEDGQHRAAILLAVDRDMRVRVSGGRAWPCLDYSKMVYR